jgi:hypothetical protein
MRYLPSAAAFGVLGLLLALPAVGADDAKKTDARKDRDKDKDTTAEQYVKAGTITGKVRAVVEAKKSVRLQVSIRVPNPGGAAGVAQAQYNLQRAMAQRNPNPVSIIQAQQALARAQQNLTKMENRDVELHAIDDVKVRMKNPPVQFDDKGRVKKYTAKELKELKGNDKQPGYPAEFADIKQDQIVEVTLVHKKGAHRDIRPRKGKDNDPDLTGDNLPQISMIIIVAEPRN